MNLKPGQKLDRKHYFRFRKPDGRVIKAASTVINAKKDIVIKLEEEHILRASKAHGQGDTSNCAGAVCVRDHAQMFSHEFLDVEWIDTRAYFVTKEKNGLPVRATVYEHHDNVAKLFVSPKGLKKPLADIGENDPKEIRLTPVKRSSGSDNRHVNRKEDGSRTPVSHVKSSSPTKGAAYRIFRTTRGLLAGEAR